MGMQWRGQWAEGTEYQPDDVVGVSGSAWVCISPSQGDPPEDSPGHWEMLASRGRGAEYVEDLLNVDYSERGPGAALIWDHDRQLWNAAPLTGTGLPLPGQPFYYDGDRGRLFVSYDGAWVDASPPIQGIQGEIGPIYRSLMIEHPRHDERVLLMASAHQLTLTRAMAKLTGTGSVTFSIHHGTDPDAAGTAVLSNRTVTGESPLWLTCSPGIVIPSDHYIWMTTSEQVGTAEQLFINLVMEPR